MKTRIPIPAWLLRAYDRFEAWANVPLVHGWHIVRLDPILAALFLGCVGWYYWSGGPLLALQGGLLFVFITMCALWIWRR